MANTSQTIVYDALLTTTLNNYRSELDNNVSVANSVYWFLKNKVKDGIVTKQFSGDKMQLGLRYANGVADTYSGYDVLPTTPTEGITAAFFPYFQMAAPISISELERKKNRGEAALVNLLKEKTSQAEDGFKEMLSKILMQGMGFLQPSTIAAILSRYRSPNNLSYGPNTIFDLVRVDPTASATIGEINQSTSAWWRNQTVTATGITTYKAYLGKLRTFYRRLTEFNVEGPTMFLSDETSFSNYETALSEFHQNPSYQKADIPFDAVQFKGKPWMWDSNFPFDPVGGYAVSGGTQTGAVLGLDLKTMQIEIDSDTNFTTTEFQKPYNQDAKVAHILLLGAIGVRNRRNQGILHTIPLTLS